MRTGPNRRKHETVNDGSARFAHARAFSGPARAFSDAVEVALADALQRAAVEHRWDVVSQLARELEARRLARSSDKVVTLSDAKRGR